jgi:PAS domain S-box-containing protein/putative nucleotidyltransferase with HDIG domain
VNASFTSPLPSLERVLWLALLGVSGVALLWLGVLGPQFAIPAGREGWVFGSSLIAALLCLYAAFRSPMRLFWAVVALGVAVVGVRELKPLLPPLDALGSLLCLGLLVYGTQRYPIGRLPRAEVGKLSLDVLLVAVSLFTVLWDVQLSGVSPSALTNPLERWGGIFMVEVRVMALLLLLSGVMMLALRRVEQSHALELFVLGLALTLRLATLLLEVRGSEVLVLGALEVATATLFGWAAFRSLIPFSALPHAFSTTLLSYFLRALPYSAVLACLTSLLLALQGDSQNGLAVGVGTAVVTLLALARQGWALLENRLLSAEVRYMGFAERQLLSDLQASEARYQSLVEHSSDLVQIISVGGRILYVSPSHRDKLGFEGADLLEQNVTLLLHPRDEAAFRALLQTTAGQNDLSKPLLYRVRHKDGGWRWLEGVAKNLLSNPAIGGIVLNARDVTEREEAQEKVSQMGLQLEARLERITTLHAIDLAISSRLPINVTLDMVLAQVNSHLNVEASAIRLKSRTSGQLEYYSGLGFKNDSARDHLLMLGSRWAENVLLEGKPLGTRLAPEVYSSWASVEGGVRYFAAPLIIDGETQGVLEVYQRGNVRREREWHHFLETLAGQSALAVENDRLLSDLQRSNRDLTAAYNEVIEGWARALDLRDKETEGHSRRVTNLSVRLAIKMGLEGDDLMHLRRGALLHDIGKMGIPDNILQKPGPLDPEEWAVMRTHPTLSYQMLEGTQFLRPALDIPYAHHEKWNGTGYPRGLKGLNIPLAARIFAVVDVWDALNSKRPYHAARSPEESLAIILEGSGSHFDPEVIQAFLTLEEIASVQKSKAGSSAD